MWVSPMLTSSTLDINFIKFYIVHLLYDQFLVFVGESICKGETALFVSRETKFFRSWV